MKKLVATLVIFVSIFLVTGALKPVRAAEENVLIGLYEDDKEMSCVETDSCTADNYKQTSMGKLSNVMSIYRTFYGMDLVPDYDPAKISLLEKKPYLRYGLVQNTTVMMSNAFYNGPTGNIPQHYAQMFLPKQLLEQGGSAYAAAWSTPPESGSSLGFMNDMGLNKLWGITFTIAMSILVIILVVAGFMIMFRSKAGGQVVVTVSLALQNAVIGAILALASYALGAFFLNLSKYLVMVIALLFEGVYAGKMDVIYINGPWKLFTDFSYTTIFGSASNDSDTWWKSAQEGIVGQANDLISGGTPDLLAKFWAGFRVIAEATTFSIINIIAKLVIGAALLVTSIRIFWTVLSTYIKMIIDIVMAPILFMVSSLPGKQSGFSSWLKRMFQNAIAVPLMFAFVNVAAFMAYNVAVAGQTCTGVDKSILTCITGGLIPGGSAGGSDWLLLAVGPSSVIALVLLNMVPAVPTMVNEMFSAKGDISKAWDGAKKSLQSMPAIGGLFQ